MVQLGDCPHVQRPGAALRALRDGSPNQVEAIIAAADAGELRRVWRCWKSFSGYLTFTQEFIQITAKIQ